MRLLCRYCAETARPACPACGRPWRAIYFVRLGVWSLDHGRCQASVYFWVRMRADECRARRWDGLRCGVGDDDTRGVIMHAIY
jgi:hypothetical protein